MYRKLRASKVRYISHLGHTPNIAEPQVFKQGEVHCLVTTCVVTIYHHSRDVRHIAHLRGRGGRSRRNAKKIALFPFRLVNYTAPFLIHTEISYLCTCRDGGTPASPPF